MSRKQVDLENRATAVNVSLPFWMAQKLQEYVKEMKAENLGLPDAFSRSDLVRICLDRFIVQRLKVKDLETNKQVLIKYENYDFIKFEAMKEYGIINPEQIDLFDN